jgi:SAM-dependent methyltransferase
VQDGVHPSAARIVDLYERCASDWDAARKRSTFFEKTAIDRFAPALPEGGTVLDIGCGAGAPIAKYLLERGLALTGVDSSASLISLCRERYPAGEWIVADMRTLDLGRRFDGLIAWWSLFHLSPADQLAMFPVFARHAAPGAHLIFTSGDRHGEAIGEFGGEELYHASLDEKGYRDALAASEFEIVHYSGADPDCGDTIWWLARMPG